MIEAEFTRSQLAPHSVSAMRLTHILWHRKPRFPWARVLLAFVLLTLAALLPLAAQAGTYTHVSTSTANDDNTGNDFTANMPGSISAGNLLIGCTRTRGSAGAETFTQPSGWTTIHSHSHASGAIYIFAKIAAGGDSGPTISFSGSNHVWAQIAQFSGDVYTTLGSIVVHTGTDVSGTGADISLPAINISTDDTLVIACGGKNKTVTSNGATVTVDDGYTSLGSTSSAGSRQTNAWGYIQQTTASNVGAATWAVSISESLSRTGVTIALQSLSAAAPAFDSGPTVTAIDNNTFRVTYDADAAADNIYCGAWAKDATPPTASQIEAGTGARGTGTEAATGSSDTLDFDVTDSPAFPIYDVYCVLEEGTSNYSDVEDSLDAYLTAPANKLYVTLASIGTGSPCAAFNTGYDPDLVAGDILSVDDETDPSAFALTVDTDCQYEYPGDESRQFAGADIYDVSAVGFHAEDLDVWFNNEAPVGSEDFDLVLPIDEAMDPIDLDTLFTDAEGDTLTYAVTSGTLPTGLSLVDGVISGTPTVEDEDGAEVEFTATDIAGDIGTTNITFYPLDDRTVPDGVGDDITTFDAELLAEWLYLGNITAECSTETPGIILSQDPAASATAAPESEVDVVVARRCSAGRGGLRLGIGLGL